MNKEIDIAFGLLRSSLENNGELVTLNSELRTLSSHDWWRLFRLLQQNHVAALTADTMAMLDVPREVKIPWLAERDKAERWHRYQREVQTEIIGVMQQHGIETLVLKGTHLAGYWPQPELREFGDLDLYFYDKHDEADRVAREVLKVEVSNDAHHHSKYNYRGVTVESHYDFVNIHYPPSNRRYESLIKELVDAKQTPPATRYPLHTFEVLFLLRHMACHFAASRITLRELVDWTLTCQALQGKVDWPLMEKTIVDYGMTDFVAVLNDIAERRLGISKSRGVPSAWPTSLEVSLTQKVEHDIVYGTVEDHTSDGLDRLLWKFSRWRALAWKRKLVYNDSPLRLYLASLTSHVEKPKSILHKL